MEDLANHFTISKKVAPLPVSIIDISTLEEALHPNNSANFDAKVNGTGHQENSRAATPGIMDREPMEILFLGEIDGLSISHNIREELCTCPCKQVLDFRTPDGNIFMKATKKASCSCTHENYEAFNTLTNELAILVEIIDGSCASAPGSIQVYAPPGRALGIIDRLSSCGHGSYEIRNTMGDTAFIVESVGQCCQPLRFPVMVAGNENWKVAEMIIGGFGWSWSIELNFIENLSPSRRALIIGLALLIDAVEWQRRSQITTAISGSVSAFATALGATLIKRKAY